jgi:ubiquinone/menaquinone biosynthesis C-methylase UbiE
MSLAAMVLADRGEHLAGFYDRWIEFITFGRARSVRRSVLDHVEPGESLLDVGCGTGTLAITAARAGTRVVAIDRSATMLAIAREKAATAGVAVDWRQADAVFPALDAEQFDVATAVFVLSELSYELALLALRRMAAAVRPGGRIVIADESAPDGLALRVLSAAERSVMRLVSFAALQQLAPTRRHPWRRLLYEAGLQLASEETYASGSLHVLVATRPARLRALKRSPQAIDAAMPQGLRGTLARAASWLDLPIAVPPAVYQLGRPGPDNPVLLTGNFLASVEAVRSAMVGRDAYLIVEDTDGWNVWCAADAGVFNAEKAAAEIELYGLDELVAAHRVIVPRLGGRVHEPLTTLTGWQVSVGPIEARDLPLFLAQGMSPSMRSLERLYRLPERIRVGVLTLIQLPLFLLPLRLLPSRLRRPAWRFALAAGCLMPLAHDRLPGRTGVAKGTVLGCGVAFLGTTTRTLRPSAALVVAAVAPYVGWIYQSSTPVVFWKRLWR